MDCPGRTSSLPGWASVPDTGSRAPARHTAAPTALAVTCTDRRMKLLLLTSISPLFCRWGVVAPPRAASGADRVAGLRLTQVVYHLLRGVGIYPQGEMVARLLRAIHLRE